MFELGIDDAGRGPVIGPMVLAGCLIDKKNEARLRKLGVRDSKQLTARRREFLAKEIEGIAEAFEVIVIEPEQIDSESENGTKLNEQEAAACAQIINRMNRGGSRIRVVLDCPSVSLVKWKDFLKTKIKNLSNLEIACEHKADKNHVSVSAASIIAKSRREKEIDKLREKYGEEIGSGYTSDPLTQRFLERYADKYKDTGLFRKTWVTWKVASRNLRQRKLF